MCVCVYVCVYVCTLILLYSYTFILLYSSVRAKLEKKQYLSVGEAAADVRLVWNNCMRYNADGSEVRERESVCVCVCLCVCMCMCVCGYECCVCVHVI
jgi:hypothetical protein